MKIVILGSINMDIVIKTDVLPSQGETVVGNDFYTSYGGKGANQAVAIGKMGIKPIFIGSVGNDVYGEEMVQSLSRNNVESSQIRKVEAITGIAMITLYNSDNRIILFPSANETITNNQVLDTISSLDEKTYFLTQFENNIDAVEYSLSLAKKRGMYTVLNPAPFKKADDSVYKGLDLLVLNKIECESIVNYKINTETKIEEALQAINKLGVRRTVLTLGSQGSILYLDRRIHRIKACKTNVVDTTCAGDSYIGALMSQLAYGKSYLEACEFAAKVASITVSRKGAQSSIPTFLEVI